MSLSLVSGVADRELDEIRGRLAVYAMASSLDEAVAVLRRHVERGEHAEVLDVSGHSRTDGFVVLGTWEIDDSPQTAAAFCVLLGPLLRKLGVQTIRLLGCSTAVTPRAERALRRIAHVTGCKTLGTKRFISSSDYGPDGFTSDHALTPPRSEIQARTI